MLFFYLSDEGGYTGSFKQFFEDWISNKIIFGSWAQHLKEYLAAAEDPQSRDQVLLVRYEDMKSDLVGCVQRVAQFLQLEGTSVSSRSDIESEIVPKVSWHNWQEMCCCDVGSCHLKCHNAIVLL